MKKIMILGATINQVPLIRTAKKKGYWTIVASISGDYPGFAEANEICNVDITNPEAVYAKAKELNIDGIATCSMDTGIRAVGYVCERMGLCGLSEKSALLSNQKLLMKEAFIRGGVNTPTFVKVHDEQDLKRAWDQIPHPLILKAVDLQASRGVYIVDTYEKLLNAFHSVMAITKQDFCIVEQYIFGKDVGAQAFVYNGEILFVLPHNDETFTDKASLPIGHSAPLDAPREIYDAIVEQCKLAIRAIELNNCAVNIDLLLADDGNVYMIELTGRVGATCLPELVSIYYGIDYYEMIIATAMGNDPRSIFEKRSDKRTANASRFLMASKTGKVKKLEINIDDIEGIRLLDIYIKEGMEVKKFADGKDRYGQVVVAGDNLQDCFEKLDEVTKKIKIIYEE